MQPPTLWRVYIHGINAFAAEQHYGGGFSCSGSA
jgi:hypothetical protein